MHARSSLLFLVAAGLLWGTGGVIGTAFADATGLSAPVVAAYRLGLGGVLLVAVALVRDRAIPRTRTAWTRIAVGGVLAAIFQSAYFTATSLGSVSSATLITIGSAPLFVLVFDTVRVRALPSLAVARPVAVGVVGLALLIGAGAGIGAASDNLAGSLVALVSGSAFAAFTVVGRLPSTGAHEITVTGYGFVVGGLLVTLCVAPFASFEFGVGAQSILLLIGFATVPTALAYALFFRGLRHVTASTATVVALLEPLTAAVLAVLFLGDRFTAAGLLGAALLVISIVDAGLAQIGRGRAAIAH